MTDHHIYNLHVYAKWVRELCDMVMETENKKIRIRDIIKFCAPRIERREERFLQLKKLSEARPIWNFKELSERIGISRQTLYNWKDEGWILTDENGKADLKRTVELWEEYKWNA